MKTTFKIAVVIFVTISCAYGVPQKKIVNWHYAWPDTNDFITPANIADLDDVNDMLLLPLDGTVFRATPSDGNVGDFTWNLWGTTVYDQNDMQNAVNELNAANFGRLTANFLRLNMAPGDVDWFDDCNVGISNYGTAAWLVNQTGIAGIMFDFEIYGEDIWSYNQQDYKDTKTFSEYEDQVFLRGQQIMDAMEAEEPNIVIFLTFGYSYVWQMMQRDGTSLDEMELGLVPAFLDGMLDAAGSGVKFIDGYEWAYGKRTLQDYENGYEVMTTDCLEIVADANAYADKFTFSMALMLDYRDVQRGWYRDPDKFNANHYTPQEFYCSLRDTLSVADEYVWIYTEHYVWWNNQFSAWGGSDIPQEYVNAVRFAWEANPDAANMDFVTVGDVANWDDDRKVYNMNWGKVDYEYQIGKHEVTNTQYAEFLNAVAANDVHGLYNVNMGDSNYPIRGGISRSGSAGSYTYSVIDSRKRMPVNWVTWRSAARFANWMHNGLQDDPNTTEYGAYDASTFTGTGWGHDDQTTHYVNAKYWIPTRNEWYKAAYFKGGAPNAGYWSYPTESNSAPTSGPYNTTANRANYEADNYPNDFPDDNGDVLEVGFYTLSPGTYDTFDMGGNIAEHVEDWDPNYIPYYRVYYGGAWKYNGAAELAYDTGFHLLVPEEANGLVGFRLARTPDTTMKFLPVLDVNNVADTRVVDGNYWGRVTYKYAIGQYEVTNAQYAEFLNAVAASDPYGLYHTNMGDANYPYRGGITQTGSSGSYQYKAIGGREHMPVNWVSWRSAARFANWMHNGKVDEPNTTEYGAYDANTFTGTGWGHDDQKTHYVGAKYWIPTRNEWYKAAYYGGGSLSANYWSYPTESNTAPTAGPNDSTANRANYDADSCPNDFPDANGDVLEVGFYSLSPGPYDNFDMGGNIAEHVEDWEPNYVPYYRVYCGGAWKHLSSEELAYNTGYHLMVPEDANGLIGFRLAKALDTDMKFVSILDANNAADTRVVDGNYWGEVNYDFAIGQYEVTNAQYAEFLNAVAASDPRGLYHTNMGDSNYPYRGGIIRTGSSGSYEYKTASKREHLPVNWVSWRSAARFANWMHNGKVDEPNTTEYGAYDANTFTGTEWNHNDVAAHDANAKYWIPTRHEWYKAAYYKGGDPNAGYWSYPTESDSAPTPGPNDSTANRANYEADNCPNDFRDGYGDVVEVGFYSLSPGPYDTFEIGGNIAEHVEDWEPNYTPYYRVYCGGAWKYNGAAELAYDTGFHLLVPEDANGLVGFRLAKKLN
ncbi:MAG: SUMF1/EgtB/PvdO family nonheme iron enzyme [Planctomycetota bacterium]